MLTCGFQGSDGSVGWNAVGENGDGVVWWEGWKPPVNQPIRPQKLEPARSDWLFRKAWAVDTWEWDLLCGVFC